MCGPSVADWTIADLPPHPRGPWTRDEVHPSPGGAHRLILYGIDETAPGRITAHAAWGPAGAAPDRAIARLPLMPVVAWISPRRFALKLLAFQGDWIRPVLVVDLDLGMALLPNSNGEAFDPARAGAATEFCPWSEPALALELDLAHLL